MINIESNSNTIKKIASDLGFDFCGISKADFLEEEAPRLEYWLKAKMQGEMGYMENYFDKRLDPRKLVEGAKSVVSLLYNYYPKADSSPATSYQISKYAFGEDYHSVIKDKLFDFLFRLKEAFGDINGRVFVDSAPVMDKVWAKKAGLGWVGKHSNLINTKIGSFFFIAELIIDIECKYDNSVKDFCGTCTRCIDACPTDAIVAPYVVDGSKCISYLTIELKNEIPAEFKGKMENWIFGCDICQDVCPWNRFKRSTKEQRFSASIDFKQLNDKDLENINEEVFNRVFSKSAIKRTKIKGLIRNIDFVRPQSL